MIHANYDSKPTPRGSNIRPMIHVSCDTRYLLYDWVAGGLNSFSGSEEISVDVGQGDQLGRGERTKLSFGIRGNFPRCREGGPTG